MKYTDDQLDAIVRELTNCNHFFTSQDYDVVRHIFPEATDKECLEIINDIFENGFLDSCANCNDYVDPSDLDENLYCDNCQNENSDE